MEEEERNLLVEKIEEWQEKSHQETDPFNKYLSIFIAYNIFYNLYWKTMHPRDDLSRGDSQRAIATYELVNNPNQLIQSLKPLLKDYLKAIPRFREEYWPSNYARNKEQISDLLKKAVKENDSRTAVQMILKWLYKVRCNLVHGEKNYNDQDQRELLDGSSSIMQIIVQHMMERFQERYR